MLKIESVDMKEFKNDIFPEYKKIFPKLERRPLINIKRTYKTGMTKIMKFMDNDICIGFAIIEVVQDNKYVWMDYFAILEKYRNKGYGTAVINLLKTQFKYYNGIFIEIEKEGFGINSFDDEIRKKRARFYERAGFTNLKCDIEIYKMIYTPYILKMNNEKEDDRKIIEELFKIYNIVCGEEFVNKHCKIIEEWF